MSPAHIRVRVLSGPRTKGEKRYDVRYRMSGGREARVEHGGTFTTLREARLRRDLVAGEIAAGRDPRAILAALRNPPGKSVV